MSFLWKKPKPYDPDKVKTRPPDGMLKKGGEVDKPMTFGYTKYGPVHIVDGKFYAVAVTQMLSYTKPGILTRVDDPAPPLALDLMRFLSGRLHIPFLMSKNVKSIKERTTWKNLTWESFKHITNLKPTGIMAMSADSQLFDESFTITTIDHAKYDRVGRFGATSADSATVMTLDINTELFPCQIGETLHCVLASSLSLDGTKDDGKGWRDVGRNPAGAEPTLADMFDYVCHGKIYKFEDGEDGHTIKIYISFGGLLMAIEGPYKKLTALRVDYVYLLVKK